MLLSERFNLRVTTHSSILNVIFHTIIYSHSERHFNDKLPGCVLIATNGIATSILAECQASRMGRLYIRFKSLSPTEKHLASCKVGKNGVLAVCILTHLVLLKWRLFLRGTDTHYHSSDISLFYSLLESLVIFQGVIIQKISARVPVVFVAQLIFIGTLG